MISSHFILDLCSLVFRPSETNNVKHGFPVSAPAERRSLANSSPYSSVFKFHLQFQSGFCTHSVHIRIRLGHFEAVLAFDFGLLKNHF